MKRKPLFIASLVAVLLIINLNTSFASPPELHKEKVITIHDKDVFSEWIEADSLYIKSNLTFSDEDLFNLYKEEIETLFNAVELSKEDYVLSKEKAKVYSPSATGKIHAYFKAIENRETIIKSILDGEDISTFNYENKYFRDGKNFLVDREIEYLLNQKSMDINYNEVVEVLDETEFPIGFLDGLEVYISPYKLKDIEGYAYTQNVLGREDYVVISYGNEQKEVNDFMRSISVDLSTETVKEVTLHELGHIFAFDVLGTDYSDSTYGVLHQNKNAWEKYLSLYEEDINRNELNKENKTWKYKISENLAEDFKLYHTKKDIKSKKTEFSYDALKIKELFDDFHEEYTSNPQYPFPEISIKFNEYKNPIKLNTHTNISSVISNPNFKVSIDVEDSEYKEIIFFVLNLDTMEHEVYKFSEGDYSYEFSLKQEGNHCLIIALPGEENYKVMLGEKDIYYKSKDSKDL